MKLRLQILSALIILITSSYSQVPNGDLENWHIYSGFLGATAEIPDGWSTPDSIAAAIGIPERFTEKESTEVQSGSFAARLTTTHVSLLDVDVPGTLTTGKIFFDLGTLQPSITGGAVITDAPEALQGYFKYTPSGADTMNVTVYIKAGDDTVGTGVYRNSDNVTAYQLFSVPITYTTPDVADSLIIIITSSGSFTSLSEGSQLYIDNMSMTGGVNVDGWASLGIKPNIYPNPASDFINIINPAKNDVIMKVYNLQGQQVDAVTLKPETNTINVTNYATGIYSFRLMENGEQVYSNKFKVVNGE